MLALEKIVKFFNVALVPATCATVSSLAALGFYVADKPTELVQFNLAFAGINVLASAKAIFEYCDVKSALAKRGFDPRIVGAKSWSWCQRRATGIATYELGMENEYKDFLRDAGYRWYHVLPRPPLRGSDGR